MVAKNILALVVGEVSLSSTPFVTALGKNDERFVPAKGAWCELSIGWCVIMVF